MKKKRWVVIFKVLNTDPIASNSGKDVVVTSIDEIEGNGVERSLAFLDPVGDLVLPLLRWSQRPNYRFTPQSRLHHPLPSFSATAMVNGLRETEQVRW